MKTKRFFQQGCLLFFLAFLPIEIDAQQLHRYVVEVTTSFRYHGRLKSKICYYEIISKTPLTTKQCDTLIRQGKAKRIPKPYAWKQREADLWNRPNMTMDGEEGINPWDAEQTEYDLMYEDPDLYDFIAD